LIEGVMLATLGFLTATLLALAALPALTRRADRLARRRAEVAFPFSLAEIAADRDHLRAELALKERAAEQKAERGFAARADAMTEIGRRDMAIAGLKRDLAARDGRIGELEGALAQRTQEGERLSETLAEREAGLAEARGMIARLDAELAELGAARETLQAEADAQRVALVEAGTVRLGLEARRDELSARLGTSEQALAEARASLAAMTVDRDSERLRADALASRTAELEAALRASDGHAVALGERIAAQESEMKDLSAARAELERRLAGLEAELALAAGRAETLATGLAEEMERHRAALRERDEAVETLHAEMLTLKGARDQARADRSGLKRELAALRRQGASAGRAGDEALRQEIVRVADLLLAAADSREAAE
jgi:chromosome segregation ATPase